MRNRKRWKISSKNTTLQKPYYLLSSIIRRKPKRRWLSIHLFINYLIKANCLLPHPLASPKPLVPTGWRLAAAAVYFYPEKHNLVIALGSCITFNFINKFGEFLGGSISPGLEMRFKAMHDHTALLPMIEPDWNFPLIGYDTKTNLLSGVILGMSKEIDGFIDEYALKFNNFNAHLTGGNMPFFQPHLKNKIFADPYFLYKGLYAISEENH